MKFLFTMVNILLLTQCAQVPQVRSTKSSRITLTRSACFGTCPVYTVQIDGDGHVRYEGQAYVTVSGVHSSEIATAQVDALLSKFTAADFFNLRDRYESTDTDLPSVELQLTLEGRSKHIYYSAAAGVPNALTKLEHAIDDAVQVTHWTVGDETTVPSLRAEKFGFRSEIGGLMLVNAARLGKRGLVQELLAEGVPLNVSGEGKGMTGTALEHAASGEDVEILRLLLEAGAGKDDSTVKHKALERATWMNHVEAIRLLEAAGAKR